MKRRIPRKTKKWCRKYGWEIRWCHDGSFFFVRKYQAFRAGPLYITWGI